jgi:hypothetical protein
LLPCLFFLAFELLLTLGLQFPLKLFHFAGQFFNLAILDDGLFSIPIHLPQQRVRPVRLFTGGKDQAAQRRSAQVRAVVHVRTTELMIGVEDEMHRPPFLGKRSRCKDYTVLLARAQ